MFALLSYPFLFEPVYTTHQQATMWSVGFAGFIALCISTAASAGRSATLPAPQEKDFTEAGKPRASVYSLWLALPACASILLLSVSNHITQNVAAIPFLWVLPLSLYLLSFILCFDGRGWFRYRRSIYVPLAAVSLVGMALGIDVLDEAAMYIQVGIFLVGIFACCMVCHGELTLLKPHPRYLTQFYLMISLGGAVGGFLVGFVAPRLFNANYELELGLALTVAVALVALRGVAEPGPGWLGNMLPGLKLLPVAFASLAAGYLGFMHRSKVLSGVHWAIHLATKKWSPNEGFDTSMLVMILLWLIGMTLVLKYGFQRQRATRSWPFAGTDRVGSDRLPGICRRTQQYRFPLNGPKLLWLPEGPRLWHACRSRLSARVASWNHQPRRAVPGTPPAATCRPPTMPRNQGWESRSATNNFRWDECASA